MKKLRGAIMVSQGQRQFEGLPKEDPGAEDFSCSIPNGGSNQSLYVGKIREESFTNDLVDGKGNETSENCDKTKQTEQAQSTLETKNDISPPSQECDLTLFVTSKVNKSRQNQPVANDLSKLIESHRELDNSMMVDMDEAGLNTFELSKETQNEGCVAKTNDTKTVDNSSTAEDPNTTQADTSENVYVVSDDSAVTDSQESSREMSCSLPSETPRSVVYTNLNSEDQVVASHNLQRANKSEHLTLGSETQLLLSGVQTIPEQLPLILTEGDAEEQESLNVMQGPEQLQAVSTQAVLGTHRPGTGGVMVISSADIAPSGHLIPISGTNLFVLQSIDCQGQVIQPNSVITAGQQQILPKPTEHAAQLVPSKVSGKQYHCPEAGCTKIAPTSSKLKLHMLSHTGERPHKCPIEGCEWAFTTAYKLKRHIRGHTGERPFICEVSGCGKCFTTTYNLKTHQKAHIREQTNVCSFPNCNQSFSTLHKLKVHEKKHQLENELHTCHEPGCGKQFKSLSNYNAHFKTHNGERPHACTFEGCGKRFTKASKLKLHLRTHTGERPFVCEEEGCDWSFTSAYKLKRHMRKHTGERPFICEFSGCGKAFTRASHMRTHALSHTGQKPFICPVADCLKGFTAASSLNIHMRKHSGDKPFKCSVEGCDKTYTTAANLRLHQKRHEDKNQDEPMEKDGHVASEHTRPVRYVEIGGVNSVVDTSPSSVPTTPYSVMHTFTGEDFGAEDVTSLTVVQFSSEETFPPQTPVSTIDSSSGICFQFSSSDSYTNPPHSNAGSSFSGLSFAAGTPLPSPGAHYTHTSIGEVDVGTSEDLETNTDEREFSHNSEAQDRTGENNGDYNVREDISRDHVVREQPVGTKQSGSKDDEDLTLPTMVVFASPIVQPSESSPAVRSDNDLDAREAEENPSSERTVSHLTLRQPCESSSIGQFAPPAIIFQGEEVKSHESDIKINYSAATQVHHKEASRSDSSLTNHNRARSNNLSSGLPVSNLNLNLSLSEEIDKSPVSPFITDVDHSLDHESTINLQDLR